MTTMTTIIIISIVVYVLSALLYWKFTSIAYSKNGIWEGVDASKVDVILMFIPVINTALSIIGWVFMGPIEPSDESRLSLKKFFKIKI